MLVLAKLAAVLVLVWFYSSAKKAGGPAVQWAVTGVIGYGVSWALANLLIASSLTGMFTKQSSIAFLVTQIPVVIGLAAAFLIRKKLLSDLPPSA